MRPAVFLDRDGTVIEETGYVDRLDLITPYAWSAAAIRDLNAAGLAVVIVTNQAGVARGYFDEAFVREAHRHLDALLRDQGAVVDGYYYCPHHPEGIGETYRRTCGCRKPAPGLVDRAARDLGLDVSRSYVVGDKWLDVELARNVGARGVLVRTGYGRTSETNLQGDASPDAVADTLRDAADWILKQSCQNPPRGR
jgi:D-glycero-D-manno-heptose 1,7-bisphosphate phosphatase